MRTSEKILKIRKLYGWSQKKLGIASGLGQKKISRIENEAQEGYGSDIYAIALAFGCSTDLLLNEAVEEFAGLPVEERQHNLWRLEHPVIETTGREVSPAERAIVAVESRVTIRRGRSKREKPVSDDESTEA